MQEKKHRIRLAFGEQSLSLIKTAFPFQILSKPDWYWIDEYNFASLVSEARLFISQIDEQIDERICQKKMSD